MVEHFLKLFSRIKNRFYLGKEETLKKIKCFLPPYPLSTSTINDLNLLIKEKYFENIKRYFPEIKKRKKRLEKLISNSHYFYNSDTNFISIKSEKSFSFFKKGLEDGLLFRHFDDESILRISILKKDLISNFFKRSSLRKVIVIDRDGTIIKEPKNFQIDFEKFDLVNEVIPSFIFEIVRF